VNTRGISGETGVLRVRAPFPRASFSPHETRRMIALSGESRKLTGSVGSRAGSATCCFDACRLSPSAIEGTGPIPAALSRSAGNRYRPDLTGCPRTRASMARALSKDGVREDHSDSWLYVCQPCSRAHDFHAGSGDQRSCVMGTYTSRPPRRAMPRCMRPLLLERLSPIPHLGAVDHEVRWWPLHPYGRDRFLAPVAATVRLCTNLADEKSDSSRANTEPVCAARRPTSTQASSGPQTMESTLLAPAAGPVAIRGPLWVRISSALHMPPLEAVRPGRYAGLIPGSCPVDFELQG
jgi:hypothetical protein